MGSNAPCSQAFFRRYMVMSDRMWLQSCESPLVFDGLYGGAHGKPRESSEVQGRVGRKTKVEGQRSFSQIPSVGSNSLHSLTLSAPSFL